MIATATRISRWRSEAASYLAGHREWLDVLDAEAANLDAALERALQTDGERALRLCAAVFHWWRLRGLFGAAERACERALDVGDRSASPLRAQVLAAYGYLLVSWRQVRAGDRD